MDYDPLYSGDLQIDVIMRINAKVVVAAGATGLIPDIEDAMLAQIGQGAIDTVARALLDVVDVAQGVLTPSAGVIEPDVYLMVDAGSGPRENEIEVTGRDYAATFPLPDFSQEDAIHEKRVTLSIILPVEAEKKVMIETGLRTHGVVHGWAFAAWNAKKDQVSYVDSIMVTELNVPSGNPDIPSFDGTIFDEMGKRFSQSSGQWSASRTGYDHHHWLISNDTAYAHGKWLLNPGSNGNWEVFVYIPNTATTSRATYMVLHNGKTDSVTINQSDHHNSWVSLGIFDFAAEGDEYLQLNNDTGEGAGTKLLGYDAVGIRWIGENQFVIPPCTGNILLISVFFLSYIISKQGRLL